MRKIYLFIGFALCTCTFVSCTQDTNESHVKLEAESVKKLTARLEVFNSTIPNFPESRLPGGVKFSKLDYAKIAITDVCGGIRGSAGGFVGIVGGAVGSSLWRGCKMYAVKYVTIQIKNQIKKSPVVTYDNNPLYEDSVGFYHNAIEYALYCENNNSHLLPMNEIISKTNSMMLEMSTGYKASGGLSFSEIKELSSQIDRMRDINDSLPYSEYFAELKNIYPNDADYIDFCASYIYKTLYANTDTEEYTKNVLYMIQKSNVDVKDKDVLYRAIQIAYASILYSQSMIITQTNSQ